MYPNSVMPVCFIEILPNDRQHIYSLLEETKIEGRGLQPVAAAKSKFDLTVMSTLTVETRQITYISQDNLEKAVIITPAPEHLLITY